MGIIDDLPKRYAIYPGDLDKLADKHDLLIEQNRGEWIDNGECARLPQVLTDVGYTGRWHRGPRVIDLAYLNPGTVIANFKIVDGNPKFPNENGWHAGLFDRFLHGAKLANGQPGTFSMFDQWKGAAPKPAGRRSVSILSPEYKKTHPRIAVPSNMADEFYVVVVP